MSDAADNPAPRADGAPHGETVTFGAILLELESQALRYALWHRHLLSDAEAAPSDVDRAFCLQLAADRARLVAIYQKAMVMIDHLRDDSVLRNRLREIAEAEAAAAWRDDEQSEADK